MNKQPSKEPPDPIDVYVGSRVKEQRIYKGMSQTKLGDALDVSFQQVQKYENGTNRISASSLYRIAETFNIDVGYFFKDFGTPGGLEDPKEPFGDTAEAIQLKKYFYQIADPKVRSRLFHVVKTLSEESED